MRTAPQRPERTIPVRATRSARRPAAPARPATLAAVYVPASGRAAAAVAYALAQVGKPYVWGAAGPGSFDCSGLVMRAWGAAGVSLPHQSGGIAARGRRVPAGQWQPGDVITFPGHVALYIGGGRMVEAPHSGALVRVVPIRGGVAVRF